MAALHSADLRLRRRWTVLWLIPVIAGFISLGLLVNYYSQRGMPITVEFQQGHGLKPGDAVRYRGIVVGQVHDVSLAADSQSIQVTARLLPSARHLARDSSRFWIVRPQVDIGRVAGLETVIGANYLGVLPGEGEFRDQFNGLAEPPVTLLEPGGLEIVLSTPGKGGLRAGAPISYREVQIGTILAVDFSADASAVEARAYIKPAYTHLIRENSYFWKTSGARWSASLTGVSFDVDSLRSLLLGGISLATPPDPANQVGSGQRFTLYDKPERAWLDWQPSLPVQAVFETRRQRPQLVNVKLSWQTENFFKLNRQAVLQGWVLPVSGGLLGLSELWSAPDSALPDSVQLTVGGQPQTPPATLQAVDEQMALLPLAHDYPSWTQGRRPAVPEDTWIVTDTGTQARFVAAHRYQIKDSQWIIDPAITFDSDWNGAGVVAQGDGAVLGFLRADQEQVQLIRLSESALNLLTNVSASPQDR
ncbi:MAG: MlaD family protein [Candidatus Competibacteraceae bacterium]|nr:MlaD family protein [Candidatus Competibacteraceae bacterium]